MNGDFAGVDGGGILFLGGNGPGAGGIIDGGGNGKGSQETSKHLLEHDPGDITGSDTTKKLSASAPSTTGTGRRSFFIPGHMGYSYVALFEPACGA